MTILALGDSFTFGAELGDLPSPVAGFFGNDYYDYNANQVKKMSPGQRAWPALLANRLGQEVDNHGVIGGSNSRIFRRAVVDSNVKPYSLVVCAWTELLRIDVSYQNEECPVSANNPKWPWIKNYFADHYNDIQEQQRFLAQLLALQSYFTSQGQSYLFIKALPVFLDQSLENLHGQLNLDNCVAWDSSMMQLTTHLPWGSHGHFLEQGHQLIADTLYNFIKDKFPDHLCG